MKKLHIKEKVVLFALGFYREIATRTTKKGLGIHLSKSVFIQFVKKVKLLKKSVRALYRNLEHLEKNKYISYTNKNLNLTKKGNKMYKELKKELKPFIEVTKVIMPKKVLKATKKLQTVFK